MELPLSAPKAPDDVSILLDTHEPCHPWRLSTTLFFFRGAGGMGGWVMTRSATPCHPRDLACYHLGPVRVRSLPRVILPVRDIGSFLVEIHFSHHLLSPRGGG